MMGFRWTSPLSLPSTLVSKITKRVSSRCRRKRRSSCSFRRSSFSLRRSRVSHHRSEVCNAHADSSAGALFYVAPWFSRCTPCRCLSPCSLWPPPRCVSPGSRCSTLRFVSPRSRCSTLRFALVSLLHGLLPGVGLSWAPLLESGGLLSLRNLHPVFYLKGGICVQKKSAVSACFHLKTENQKMEESQIYFSRLSAECK